MNHVQLFMYVMSQLILYLSCVNIVSRCYNQNNNIFTRFLQQNTRTCSVQSPYVNVCARVQSFIDWYTSSFGDTVHSMLCAMHNNNNHNNNMFFSVVMVYVKQQRRKQKCQLLASVAASFYTVFCLLMLFYIEKQMRKMKLKKIRYIACTNTLIDTPQNFKNQRACSSN